MSVSAVTADRLSALVTNRVMSWRDELLALGDTLVEGSGAMVDGDGRTTLAVHSIFGPPDQAKSSNQDAALLWRPAGLPRIRWAAAVADGVSRSLFAGEASRLACYAALVALARSDLREQRLAPLALCTRFFTALGERIAAEPESFRPAACYHSTWTRVVRDARLLQTTLQVTWATDSQLCLTSLGDGGVVVQHDVAEPALVYAPRPDRGVNCLGMTPPPWSPDLTLSVPIHSCQTLCLFTDGLTPVVRKNPGFLLQVLRKSADMSRPNPAADVTRFLGRSGVNGAADNQTLFSMVRGG